MSGQQTYICSRCSAFRAVGHPCDCPDDQQSYICGQCGTVRDRGLPCGCSADPAVFARKQARHRQRWTLPLDPTITRLRLSVHRRRAEEQADEILRLYTLVTELESRIVDLEDRIR